MISMRPFFSALRLCIEGFPQVPRVPRGNVGRYFMKIRSALRKAMFSAVLPKRLQGLQAYTVAIRANNTGNCDRRGLP